MLRRYANAEPNTHVCPVCLGLPGALPVINRAAIEGGMLTGLALDCNIPPYCKLDRKNYVYPDLPKGYQISQYDLPLCVGWRSRVRQSGGETVPAGITRVHIEEDTGRLVHRTDADGAEISLVDLNRSGVPLMEIVGEPDLRSPEQARDYLIALRQILRYIGVSTGNMEEGAFRCDANISVRSVGDSELGRKVEIKNMNSFRAVERALRFEEQRQREVLAGRRRDSTGNARLGRGRAASRCRSAPRSRRTTTAISRSPILPPLTFDATAAGRCANACRNCRRDAAAIRSSSADSADARTLRR